MLQGIYTAAAGMLANDAISEVIANNLANASTPGFRQDFATFHMAAEERYGNRMVLVPRLALRSYTHFQPGSLEATQNDLDVALEDRGENFFVVQTPRGRRFTRAGNFTLDPTGRLTTQEGYPVLGHNGPIFVRGGKVQIGPDGTVQVDGSVVDRLLVVHFTPVNGRLPLLKEGEQLFRPRDAQSFPRITPNPRVRQGYLERSNVGLIQQMAEMIRITRGFEAYQRAILVADSSLNMLIQRVGGG